MDPPIYIVLCVGDGDVSSAGSMCQIGECNGQVGECNGQVVSAWVR